MAHQLQLCPERLRCPITNKLMKDPVMASDGYTYERGSVTDWILFNCTSPITGVRISSELIPNHEKKAQIDQWNEKQLKRMRGPCDIEPLLARVAWASSSDEACTELTNLSSIIAQNQLLIPEHKLRRMRLCLSSDENVWCPRVAQLLDSLEPPSAAPNNSNTTHKQKKQTMTSAARADRAEEEELKRVTIWNPTDRKKSSGNRAPYKKNLEEYLRSHPGWEVYDGQDKHEFYPTLTKYVTSRHAVASRPDTAKIRPHANNMDDAAAAIRASRGYLAAKPAHRATNNSLDDAAAAIRASRGYLAAKPAHRATNNSLDDAAAAIRASMQVIKEQTLAAAAKEEQATGGLMALCAATQPSAPPPSDDISQDRSPPRLTDGSPTSCLPVTPDNGAATQPISLGTPATNKRITSEDPTFAKPHKTNHQRRPIIKALTTARRMAVQKFKAEIQAARTKAEVEAKAATEAEAEAVARAASQVAAADSANRLVQQHFQAANSRFHSFLTANAPKSGGPSFQISHQEIAPPGCRAAAPGPVVTKRRRTNRYDYLEVSAAPSRKVQKSGALMFVDETKSQQQCWQPSFSIGQTTSHSPFSHAKQEHRVHHFDHHKEQSKNMVYQEWPQDGKRESPFD